MQYEIDTAELMRLVDDHRHAQRITWRKVAEETGLSYQTLSQFKTGAKEQPSLSSFLALIDWLPLTEAHKGRLMNRLTVIKEET